MSLARVPKHDENCPEKATSHALGSSDSRGLGLSDLTNRIRGLRVIYGSTAKQGKVHEDALREEDVSSRHAAKIKPPATLLWRSEGRPFGEDAESVMTQFLQPPSGPRKANEGVDEMEQRVIDIIESPARNLSAMHVTLLAAGFVIGPGGHSIRAICERSGANIQSCTRSAPWAAPGRDCILRAFMIMGSDTERTAAKGIIASAVKLYQDLFTGRLGKSGSRHQYLCGIKFIWSPPPKSAVPDATPLQDMAPCRPRGTRGRSGRGRHYTLGEPEEPLVYSPSGTVGYCTATNECGAPGGDMPGPMYVPAADSPQQIGPLMATYWVLQADVQSAMFGGVPGNRAIMPFAQTDHQGLPLRTPMCRGAAATNTGHTGSSKTFEYSAQLSACARSSYRVLFDTQ